MPATKLERTDLILIAAFLAAMVFPLQYAARSLDDNTLTNWQWVFRQGGAVEAYLLVLAAVAAALLLSGPEPADRWHPAILILSAAAAVVPLWNAPEPILDASRYFSEAKYLALHGPAAFLREWGGAVSVWTDLPAVPFLYGMAFRHLGETRAAAQTVTTLLFVLAVVSTCRIGRKLWDAETGLLAGLLLLAIPYLLVQVPLLLVDVPTMALLILALDAFLCAALDGGPALVAAPLLIVSAFLAKFSAWPMLFVLAPAARIAAERGGAAAMRRSFIVLGVAAAFAGACIAAKYEVIAGQLALLREYQLPGLGRWGESTISTFFLQVHPFVTLLAGWGAVAAVRRKEAAFAVPAFFVLFALAFRVERIRYLLPLFPLLALMAAYGLRELTGDGRVRRFAAVSAAGASLVLALCAYLPFLNSTTMANLRDAGRYLDSLPGGTVEVFVLPQERSLGSTAAAVPLLDLFTRKRIVHQQGQLPKPAADSVLRSPLRFTWETAMPGWYAGAPGERAPLRVIIAPGGEAIPQGAGGTRFDRDTGTFRYRTALTVIDRSVLARRSAHEL